MRGGVICPQSPSSCKTEPGSKLRLLWCQSLCVFLIFFCQLACFGRALRTGHAYREALLLKLVKMLRKGRGGRHYAVGFTQVISFVPCSSLRRWGLIRCRVRCAEVRVRIRTRISLTAKFRCSSTWQLAFH